MSQIINIHPDESIAAVKWRDQWRFFYDEDIMFLLDYTKNSSYFPVEGGFRYGTLIVDESNVELWMNSMAGELTEEQIPYVRWADDEQVKLTFVIDFDVKLWVGYRWQNDQSAYQDYQPDGWIAIEDDVHGYLSTKLSKLWDTQLFRDAIIVRVDDIYDALIPPQTRAGSWGASRTRIDISSNSILIEYIRTNIADGTNQREVIYQRAMSELDKLDAKDLDIQFYYNLNENLSITIRSDIYSGHYIIKHIDEFTIHPI